MHPAGVFLKSNDISRVEEKSVTDLSLLWRRLDHPGYESARLSFLSPFWHLTGTAVFAHNQQPCRLDYGVVCDAGWRTLSGRVEGWFVTELKVNAAGFVINYPDFWQVEDSF